MPWPVPVIRQFEKVPDNPSKADFHGAYNKLLYTLFPADSRFTVVPQLDAGSGELTGFLVYFDTWLENRPVFLLEIQSPQDLRYVSKRERVDKEIRNRIRDLAADWPIPLLFAVSAMGRKLCFYSKLPDQPIHPLPPLDIHPNSLDETDLAPRERWEFDVLEGEGQRRFIEMIDKTKQACDELWRQSALG